jgi:hypothetical protein
LADERARERPRGRRAARQTRVKRHQERGPQGYGRVTPHGRAQALTMSRFADVVVRVAETLPEA